MRKWKVPPGLIVDSDLIHQVARKLDKTAAEVDWMRMDIVDGILIVHDEDLGFEEEDLGPGQEL